jgi:hypothetical protein
MFASILAPIARQCRWVCTSEARSALEEGFTKRLDLYLATKDDGPRYGIAIISHGNETAIENHYNEQATVYQKSLNLNEVLIVNFCSTIPDERFASMFPQSPDKSIRTIHVCIPRPKVSSEACIMVSIDPTEDHRIMYDPKPVSVSLPSTKKRMLDPNAQEEDKVFVWLQEVLNSKSTEDILKEADIKDPSSELISRVTEKLPKLLGIFCCTGWKFHCDRVVPQMSQLLFGDAVVAKSLFDYFTALRRQYCVPFREDSEDLQA